jgi:ketosteroid isomerase-like protein
MLAVSPDDTIELLLTEDGMDTLVRLRWQTSSPPDERGIAISRKRLNTKLGADRSLLGPGDQAVAEAACRTFGKEGTLDAGRFLASTNDILLVAEGAADILGWVYGHELIHPDGEATMLL